MKVDMPITEETKPICEQADECFFVESWPEIFTA